MDGTPALQIFEWRESLTGQRGVQSFHCKAIAGSDPDSPRLRHSAWVEFDASDDARDWARAEVWRRLTRQMTRQPAEMPTWRGPHRCSMTERLPDHERAVPFVFELPEALKAEVERAMKGGTRGA